MAFGQSYLVYKIVSALGTAFSKANGGQSKEDNEAFGAVCGSYVGGIVGLFTGDAAGGAAMSADAALKLKKAKKLHK